MIRSKAKFGWKNIFFLFSGIILSNIMIVEVMAADKMETIKRSTLPDLTTIALLVGSGMVLLTSIIFVLFIFLYSRVCLLEKIYSQEHSDGDAGPSDCDEIESPKSSVRISGKYLSMFLFGFGFCAITFSLGKCWMHILTNGLNMFSESGGVERYVINAQALNISWVTILGSCILLFLMLKSIISVRKIEKKTKKIIGVKL